MHTIHIDTDVLLRNCSASALHRCPGLVDVLVQYFIAPTAASKCREEATSNAYAMLRPKVRPMPRGSGCGVYEGS